MNKLTTISFPYFGIEIDPVRFIEIGPLKIHLYALIIGLGLMLFIPEKSFVWGMAAAMMFLMIVIMKQFRDGLDDEGIMLSGRRTTYDQWEKYSMRKVDKIVEFRLYRPGKIRLMSFPQKYSQNVERLLVSKGLKKQEFQEVTMTKKAKN